MELMQNFYGEEAVIDYSMEDVGIIVVRVEGVTREFKREYDAVRFLERLGYRF